jgi:DNA-binding MarR family transcriptional regulator
MLLVEVSVVSTLAVLTELRRVDFAFLRDTLELTDGNLSRHLQVLERSGYVEVDKVFERRQPRTWLRATDEGSAAFARELASLRMLIERIDGQAQRQRQGQGSRAALARICSPGRWPPRWGGAAVSLSVAAAWATRQREISYL